LELQLSPRQIFNQWNDLNTYAQTIVAPIKSQLIIGDSTTSGEIFDGFGYRGVICLHLICIQIANKAMRLRSVMRKTNAKVVIKQNGYVVHQINVAPGPFKIEDINTASLNGDLVVTIEENDGSLQTFKCSQHYLFYNVKIVPNTVLRLVSIEVD
jgi:outer membrane usher protein